MNTYLLNSKYLLYCSQFRSLRFWKNPELFLITYLWTHLWKIKPFKISSKHCWLHPVHYDDGEEKKKLKYPLNFWALLRQVLQEAYTFQILIKMINFITDSLTVKTEHQNRINVTRLYRNWRIMITHNIHLYKTREADTKHQLSLCHSMTVCLLFDTGWYQCMYEKLAQRTHKLIRWVWLINKMRKYPEHNFSVAAENDISNQNVSSVWSFINHFSPYK